MKRLIIGIMLLGSLNSLFALGLECTFAKNNNNHQSININLLKEDGAQFYVPNSTFTQYVTLETYFSYNNLLKKDQLIIVVGSNKEFIHTSIGKLKKEFIFDNFNLNKMEIDYIATASGTKDVFLNLEKDQISSSCSKK